MINLFKKVLQNFLGATFEVTANFRGVELPYTKTVTQEDIDEIIENKEYYINDFLWYNFSKTPNMELSKIKYIKNGFGFTTYNVFCHASKFEFSSEFEATCKEDKLFLVTYEKGAKGKTASKIQLFELLNDEDLEFIRGKMEIYAKDHFDTIANRDAINDYCRKLREAKEREIFELVGNYKKEVISEFDSYGGLKKYNFWFEREIDKDTFIKFLELLDLVTKAKPLEAPISPELVEFYPITKSFVGLPSKQGWYYHWHGEWDD